MMTNDFAFSQEGCTPEGIGVTSYLIAKIPGFDSLLISLVGVMTVLRGVSSLLGRLGDKIDGAKPLQKKVACVVSYISWFTGLFGVGASKYAKKKSFK
jgi:uncharacterized membrane protein